MPYFDNLRTYRQQAGMSMTKLASLSGVSRDTIAKAEKHHSVRAEKLHPVLDALNEEYFIANGNKLDRKKEITNVSKYGGKDS